MNVDIHKAFRHGAEILAKAHCEYTTLHKGHGIDQAHWDLLTQKEYWSPDQTRQIRSILANVIDVSMTIAGMPAIPLPGQYTAAIISEIVSPANRLLACVKAPDTFDAEAASGMMQTHAIQPMGVQQLMSIVIAYSGHYDKEPHAHGLPREIVDHVKKANQK